MEFIHKYKGSVVTTVILGLVVLSACGVGDPATKADTQLRNMSDLLAGAESFTVSARQELAVVDAPTVVRDIQLTVERPGKLRAETSGDQGSQTTVFDGQAVRVAFFDEKVWAALEAPGSIDEMVDLLAEENEMFIFLADLLAESPYDSLMVEGTTGTYEKATLDGVKCHHLIFQNEFVDWQLWIPTAGDPLPSKFHIAYKGDAPYSSFTASFSDWKLNPELTPETFAFSAPEDFEQIDFVTRRSS